MSYKTIKQKSYQDIQNEAVAGGAITPGHNVRLNADGEVIVNTTNTGPSTANFAIEDALQGKTTRDAYAEGDIVRYWTVQPGEEVLAIIDSGFDPDVGAILEPSTGGELKAQSAGNGPLYEVLEAKQIDDADTPNHRIRVRRI